MSKIFKAANIIVEDKNVFNLEVPKLSALKLKKDYEARQERKKEKEEDKLKTHEDVIKDAKEEAADIVKKAEEEAYSILNEAKEKAELDKQKIFEIAKDEGYNEGYEEGYSKGTEEAEKIKQDATKVYDDTLLEREKILESIEPQIVDLVLKISSKILDNTYAINPRVILSLIRQGLANSNIADELQIHVSPDDYEVVLKSKEEIISMTDGTVSLDIIKDFSLNKGDCIIETPFGDIDCSLEQQFKSLKNSLCYICENR